MLALSRIFLRPKEMWVGCGLHLVCWAGRIIIYNMKFMCLADIISFCILEYRSVLTCPPTMRTNTSRWSCSFSDLAWKEKHFCDVENLKKYGHGELTRMSPLAVVHGKGSYIIVMYVLIMIYICKKHFLSVPRQGMSNSTSKIMLPNISLRIRYHWNHELRTSVR